jgi:hypothetical protein
MSKREVLQSSLVLELEDLVLRVDVLHAGHRLAQFQFQLLTFSSDLIALPLGVINGSLVLLLGPGYLFALLLGQVEADLLVAELSHLAFKVADPLLELVTFTLRLIFKLARVKFVLLLED